MESSVPSRFSHRASTLAPALGCALVLVSLAGCTSQSQQQSGQSQPEEVRHTGKGLGSSVATPRPSEVPSPKPSPSGPALVVPTPLASANAPQTAAAPPPSPIPVVPDRIIHIQSFTSSSGAQRFDPHRFEVIAGQQVEVILHNSENPRSGISHNWVLIKPGSEAAVAALGKDAGVDPDAVTYSPSILASTRTTRPSEENITDFVAPEIPGEYPYISLVGEQRSQMRGIMVVRSVNSTPKS